MAAQKDTDSGATTPRARKTSSKVESDSNADIDALASAKKRASKSSRLLGSTTLSKKDILEDSDSNNSNNNSNSNGSNSNNDPKSHYLGGRFGTTPEERRRKIKIGLFVFVMTFALLLHVRHSTSVVKAVSGVLDGDTPLEFLARVFLGDTGPTDIYYVTMNKEGVPNTIGEVTTIESTSIEPTATANEVPTTTEDEGNYVLSTVTEGDSTYVMKAYKKDTVETVYFENGSVVTPFTELELEEHVNTNYDDYFFSATAAAPGPEQTVIKSEPANNSKKTSQVFKVPRLPDTSVWCNGRNVNDRICRFRNLCYDPKVDKWLALRTTRSIYRGVPKNRNLLPFLSLSTVQDHNIFYWNFVDIHPDYQLYRNVKIRYETEKFFILARLHPNNIMHNLHDEAIGLYHLLKEYSGDSGYSGLPFSAKAQRLLFYDPYEYKHSSRVFQYFTTKELLFKDYLTAEEDTITCFHDAIVGNSKITTWYDYGFFAPQGPIKKKNVQGELVREVAEYYARRMGETPGMDEIPRGPVSIDENGIVSLQELTLTLEGDNPDVDIIVVLSRKGNRKITNEDSLLSYLSGKYGLPAYSVSNEEHSFEEQVKFMRRAKYVVGMHGSILAMAMFMRRGSILVEMFPYALDPENYTPYKTLANLKGMDLVYRSWVQMDKSKCVGFADRHELNGGLDHLSEEERQAVIDNDLVKPSICCTDPNWLYKIYQDTEVTLEQIGDLIDDAIQESREKLATIKTVDFAAENPVWDKPISNLRCLDGPFRKAGVLWLGWEEVLDGVVVDEYEIHVSAQKKNPKNNGRVFFINGNVTMFAIPGFKEGQKLSAVIAPIQDGDRRTFTYPIECTV